MNILDIKCMLDVTRFRKINIDAKGPKEVYTDKKMVPENNVEFLKQCARLIPVINFADYRTGHVYARLEHGKWNWRDKEHFARILEDPDARAGLEAIVSHDADSAATAASEPPSLEIAKAHTMGAWGAEADRPIE